MKLGTGSKLLSGVVAFGVAVLLALSAPANAQAQQMEMDDGGTDFNFGVEGTYLTDSSDFGAGARLKLGIASGFGVMADGVLYFPSGADVGDVWGINGNVTYTFATGGSIGPYVGGGVNHLEFPVGSDTGFNILGGVELGSGGGITPFAEGRYITTGTGELAITGGFLF